MIFDPGVRSEMITCLFLRLRYFFHASRQTIECILQVKYLHPLYSELTLFLHSVHHIVWKKEYIWFTVNELLLYIVICDVTKMIHE